MSRKRHPPGWRNRGRRNRAAKCTCGGWPFPHRIGSRSASGYFEGCTTEGKRKW